MDVVLEVAESEAAAAKELQIEFPDRVRIVSTARFRGDMGVIAAIVTLSATLIPSLAKIVIEQIRARRHVSITIRGVQVRGITEDNAVEILKGLLSSGSRRK